jgi:Cu/Zn superoxide dismutase
MKWIRTSALALLIAAGFLVSRCASSKVPEGATARATLESRSGSKVTGTATFTELTTGGVRARIHIENASPGTHGLHIHENGDCSDPEAKNAGGHFNPGGMQHAGPKETKRHAGDLGTSRSRPMEREIWTSPPIC